MKIILFFIALVFTKVAYTQNCSAVINWRYLEVINLYDKPKGIIVAQMKNDSINENYLHLSILDEKQDYFLVSIVAATTNESKNGWIKKADYIGSFVKHENFPMDLILYKKKEISDKNKLIVKDWEPTLLTIEKCNDN